MLAFFESIHLRESFLHSLKVIEAKNPTAEKQGKGECCRSGVCCWRRPGSLSKEDVQPLAEKFGLTPKEFFKEYLVVDDIHGKTLLPRRKHQGGGEMLGWRETYSLESPCVFLNEDNSCQVHEVKPKTCRDFRCWEKDNQADTVIWSEEDLMELGWDGINPDDDY